MSKNIIVEVNSIRLEENTESPIMLLLDPSSQKVLPIWIGTIEAVSIAYAQEGIKHPRPQTHDLLVDVIESLNAKLDEVIISDLKDNTYFAEIVIIDDNGKTSLSCRPSDAIALALRTDTKISVNIDLFLSNSIDLIQDKTNEIEEFKTFIENIEPEDFV
ncbi:bifunctional nuclease family protein [Acidimicrobiaceae bacterium]|nr:bifunctional nuclease family protein [Acidimicrobiaceae bacterium]|tara:strand:- start:201 stop:680 length:480 start_codon:yes stop_codon:yes gene_type:complete